MRSSHMPPNSSVCEMPQIAIGNGTSSLGTVRPIAPFSKLKYAIVVRMRLSTSLSGTSSNEARCSCRYSTMVCSMASPLLDAFDIPSQICGLLFLALAHWPTACFSVYKLTVDARLTFTTSDNACVNRGRRNAHASKNPFRPSARRVNIPPCSRTRL